MNLKKIMLLFFCLFMVSCSAFDNVYTSTGQKITVQKKVVNSNNYEDFNEITNTKKVQRAIKIVKGANWTKGKVKMSRYPDYMFQFPLKDSENNEEKIASYSLWINSNVKRFEMVTDSSKYVELSEQESKVLLNLLTEQS